MVWRMCEAPYASALERNATAVAAFDDRNAFAPTEHIWVSEKIDWVRLDDGLRQYQETVPQ